jgi:hypothetical protein
MSPARGEVGIGELANGEERHKSIIRSSMRWDGKGFTQTIE